MYRDYLVPAEPEHVLRHLRSVAEEDLLPGISAASEGAVVAWTGIRTFRLRVAHLWSNAFAPVLYGTVSPDQEGTLVRVSLSYRHMVRGFLFLMYGICLAILLLSRGDRWLHSIIGMVAIFGASRLMSLFNRTDRAALLLCAEQAFGPPRGSVGRE